MTAAQQPFIYTSHSPCYPVTLLPCHPVTLLPCYPVTLSPVSSPTYPSSLMLSAVQVGVHKLHEFLFLVADPVAKVSVIETLQVPD